MWAGTTVTAVTGGIQTGFITNIPFTASATKMNIRVWSPHAGIQVRLKVEDKNDPTRSCETEATVTVASGWQTLVFNFANQASGTAALNFAFSYNKVSIFFNFGVTGATAGERTYYFDDVKFGAGEIPPAPTVTTPVNYCLNSTASSLTATADAGNTLLWYNVATGGTGNTIAPIPSTTTTGTTNYYVSQVNALLNEGPRALIAVIVKPSPLPPTTTTAISYCKNSTSSILAATAATGNILNWYSNAIGGVASAIAPTPVTNSAGIIPYYVSQSNAEGCESQRTAIIVTINELPSTPVIAAAPYTKLFPGLSTAITLTGVPVTGSSYLWSRNGLFTGQSGNTANINIDALGDYTLTVTDVAGCSATSNTISISDSSSRKLFIYPNPTSGKFQVRFYSDINNLNPRLLAIYDSKGALVHKGKYVIFGAYTSIAVDLSAMTSGIYYVYLMDVDGKKLATDKVLITR